jgi:integrase
MSLRKVGNVWIYRCKVNGKTWDRSTGETDKRKALAKVTELEALAQLHRAQPVKSVKLSQAIVPEIARIEIEVSKQQAVRSSCCLRNFLRWLERDIDLNKINTDLLAQYQRARLQKAAGETVKRELHAVCVMLRQNKIRVEPPKRIPGRKTEQRDFTQNELVKFFAACDADQKVLFSFLLATGARPAEVVPSVRSTHVALLKTDLADANNTVFIRTAKLHATQRDKPREIFIPDAQMQQLVQFAQRTPGPHIFTPNRTLCVAFDRILQQAGIPKKDELGRKLTAHSFRHTYASMMAKRVSYNPHVLKEILGHRQLSTADRYIHARGSAAEMVAVTPYLTPSGELSPEGGGVSLGGKNLENFPPKAA